MFLRVVILVFAAACCTARVIGDTYKQNPWEQSGKFEGDIMLTDEELRNGLINPAGRWPNETDPFVTDDVSYVRELQNAWELSGKLEGDIILTEGQLRTGIINTARRWPNKTVPFVIDDVFTANERNRIQLVIDDFHDKTTIRFREYNPQTDRDFVHITGNNDGCWSFVGRIGRRQQLNLQRNGCLSHGTITHELLHALGFFHMQSATDRDRYVTIFWNNIIPGMENNFQMLSARQITSFGVPYDYGSIMHYSAFAFSRNGQRTIQPTDPNAQIGQNFGFSAKDIERLELMYSSSYATRSQFITLIIISLNVLTHLQ